MLSGDAPTELSAHEKFDPLQPPVRTSIIISLIEVELTVTM